MKEITTFRNYLNEGLDTKNESIETIDEGIMDKLINIFDKVTGIEKFSDCQKLDWEGDACSKLKSDISYASGVKSGFQKSSVVTEENIEEMDTHSEDADVASNFKEGKMTKQALKEKIKAEILSTLSEADDDDERDKNTYFGADAKDKIKQRREKAVDFLEKHKEKYGLKEDEDEDVDVEDVDVDIDVEAPAETSSEPGLTSDEMEIQNSLKRAYDTAVSIGDEKLSNQIANSITFFTKTHVVPRD